MTQRQDGKTSLGLRELIPGVLKNARRLPEIAFGGISTFLLFDELFYSVGSVLERQARRFADRKALMFEGRSWTYAELNREANLRAHVFRDYGVAHGHTVIVFMENRADTLITVAALAKLGAVASLINANQRRQVLAHSMGVAPGRFYCIGEEVIDAFEEAQPEREAGSVCFFVRDSGKRHPPEGYNDLYALTAGAPDENLKETRAVRTRDHLAYIFTSGTTGMPKASIQTHKQWLRSMNWFGRINLGLKPEDVLYVSIPFFHANALMIAWPSAMGAGAALAVRRKFSASEFWNDVDRFHATAFIYIGEICRYLLNAPESPGDAGHGIKKIIGNGLRPEIWESFKERFGIDEIYEFYGASDSNIIFTNTFNAGRTVGWSPAIYAIVEYDRERDQPVRGKNGYFKRVKTGGTGLMISKITNLFPFPGYVNKKHNEEKVFTNVFRKGDQWFNTGDMMRDIGYGHVQFVDRLGDTFRWKGENVATAEVEGVMHVTDWIDTVAVYGVELPGCDGRAGMAAAACKRPPTDDELHALAQRLKSDLPAYAVPVFLRLAGKLEVTETHKIRKHKLRTEGFRTAGKHDRIYVLLPGEDGYTPLTGQLLEQIEAGRISW